MPRVGERYRPRNDVPLIIGIQHGEVGMGRVEGILPGGETIEIEDVLSDIDMVFARPVRYEDLERMLVPAEHRDAPAYGGYLLAIELRSLLADFDLTSAAA